MPRRRQPAIAGMACALVAATVATLLPACGRGPVPPEEWAAKVCATLAPWRSEISQLTARARDQMERAQTPEQAKQSLLPLLDGVAKASDVARVDLDAAGAPDVTGGPEVVARFIAAVVAARDAYAHARDAVKALPTTDEKAFYDQLIEVFAQLNREYGEGALDPDRIGVESEELRHAFDAVGQCR